MRGISKFHNALLTGGAALGAVCLLFAVAGVLFGIKPLMFKSGSMDPTITTGALALSLPVDAADIHVGDIVSTENSASVRITHRVAAVQPADGYTVLTLKGDANEVVDAEVYAVTEVDRVIWSAPLLGYVVAWLSSPVALFLGGLLTAYLLYVAFGPRSRQDAESGRDFEARAAGSGRRVRRRRRHALRRTTSVALTGGLALASGTFDIGERAWAQFEDSATAHSSFNAGVLPAPKVTCANDAGDVILKWAYQGLPAAPTFAITWSESADTPKSGWKQLTVVSANQVRVKASSFDAGILSLGGKTPRYLHVRAMSGSWRSADGISVTTTYTAPLQVGLGVTPSSLECA